MKNITIIKIDTLKEVKPELLNMSSGMLFITSTKSLSYRLKQNSFSDVIDFTQLDLNIKESIKKEVHLSENEMRYILYKTIMKIDCEDNRIKFKNSIAEIYSFFDKLLISEISENDINLIEIKKTQLLSYYELFNLYIKFIKEIRTYKRQTFHQVYLKHLSEYINSFEKVSLAGFTFSGICQEKCVSYFLYF